MSSAYPSDAPWSENPSNVLTLLDRFDAAWQVEETVRIEEFLTLFSSAGRTADEQEQRELLEGLVRIDLEYRWRRAGQNPTWKSQSRTGDVSASLQFEETRVREFPEPVSGTAKIPADSESEETLARTVEPFPERPLLEDYVERYVELGSADRLPMELIVAEYRVRQRWGGRPNMEEYLVRFSKHGPELRQVLEALAAEPITMLEEAPAAEEPMFPTLAASGLEPASLSEQQMQATVAAPKKAGRHRPLPKPSAIPGYEILDELGRGGMGVVYKARQKALNRTVALKMILAGGRAGSNDLARFRIEAEAAARLQHPNIVQIHEVGEEEGRPWFSLEYVDGDSLLQKLAAKPQVPRSTAQTMEILARAMHYAHERGIVHRDLKPANILLTSAGTPKITDFGLAKRLDEDSSQTRTGTLLGTPSYMAPEQAAGKVREIGPATDVYALGAVLYEMLTGRPPFHGQSAAETVLLVLSQEPVSPSRLVPKVPQDLETICLKCLEKEPRRRYADALSLAEDLSRFLAGESIRARPASPWERTLKWIKRRPAVAALLLVSSLAVFSLTGGGFYLAHREHDRAVQEEQLRQTAETERDRAIEQEQLAEKRRREAEQAHQRAENNFLHAQRAVDQMLTGVGQVRLAHEPHMEKVRRELLEKALAFYDAFAEEKSDDPRIRAEKARARQRVGDIQEMLGKLPEAEKAYDQALQEFPDEPAYQRDRAAVYNNLAIVRQALGRHAEAESAYRRSQAIKADLAAQHPQAPEYRRDLANGYYNWGIVLQTRNRAGEAENVYLQARKHLLELTADFPQAVDYPLDLARVSIALGVLFQTTGRPEEAEKTYRQVLDLLEKHGDGPPLRYEKARALFHLGTLRILAGRHPEAETNIHEAVKEFAQLVEQFPAVPDYRLGLAGCYNNLGELLRAGNRPQEALQTWHKAADLFTALAVESPSFPLYRREEARTRHNMGVVLTHADRLLEADEAHGRAGLLRQELADRFPTEPVYRQELASTYNELGVLRAKANRLDEAERHFGRAAALMEELDPAVPVHLSELIAYQTNLAKLLTTIDVRSREAEQHWRRVVALRTKQVDAFPRNANYENELGASLYELAELLLQRNKPKEARPLLQSAIRHQRLAAEIGPMPAAEGKNLCRYYLKLLEVLVRLEDHEQAVQEAAALRQASSLDETECRRVAGLLAKCASLADKDDQLPEAKRHELRRTYGDSAVALLRQAIAQGYADFHDLETSSDFDTLRTRDDFKKLLARPAAK